MWRANPSIHCIFDMGANVGTVTKAFRLTFSGASIFSSEPVQVTFKILERNVGGLPDVSCHQLALGVQEGSALVFLADDSTANSLRESNVAVGSEQVEVQTVDAFCERHGIPRIDLLKTDTEGSELEVFEGARQMLSSAGVPFVLGETGFHPGDKCHVLFEDLRDYLLPFGFRVFGIYDQHLEWSGQKTLRFANVCFCNEAAISR
jgi:FkbM family methyltransferase